MSTRDSAALNAKGVDGQLGVSAGAQKIPVLARVMARGHHRGGCVLPNRYRIEPSQTRFRPCPKSTVRWTQPVRIVQFQTACRFCVLRGKVVFNSDPVQY
jgi:hypothetical protein